MLSIRGEYTCKVDAKGRFLMPSGFKSQLGDAIGDGFIIKKSIFSKCLELYPTSNWELNLNNITRKLNKMLKKHNDLIRAYTTGLRELNVDGSSRVLIPKDLLQFAEIESDIVLTAKFDCIEIWNKTLFDKTVEATLENISSLAEEILGGVNINE